MFLRPNLINISRYVSSTATTNSPRTISGPAASLYRPFSNIVQLQRLRLPAASQNPILARRTYATGNDAPQPRRQRSLPRLMDFPELVWPSVMKSIKNWIMVHFIIRPYFDREFSLPDFVQGAKQALQVVSASLAGGELKNLDGLVERQTLNDLRTAIGKMSVAQRYDLMVAKEDIYFSFPYQVGVMFDEEDEASQKRFVEITMVFHVLKGLKGMIERGEPIPLNIGVMPEFRDKICICNYRFIKEFTKGVESDWTVNIVNHFKASDLAEEQQNQ